MGRIRLPIACTLSAADLGAQAGRWRRLRDEAGLARLEVEDGLRLTFRGDQSVEDELRALVAVENDCCAWASWTVTREGRELVLHAVSTGEGVATLHSMFNA